MRHVGLLVVLLVLGAVACSGASKSFPNRTGAAVSGVTVRFSEPVRISSYDATVFPVRSPAGSSREWEFTFGGGTLESGMGFRLSWSPSSAEITGFSWIEGCAAPLELSRNWNQIPYALRFYQRPVGFYCDGDTDFSHAQFAGRPGCRVKGVSVALFDDALIVRVDLHEDDAFGIYRYITSLYVEGARVLVFLDPLRNSAQLSYDTGQMWKDLTVIDGCQVGKHGGTAFAIVPLSLWSGYADHRTLAGSRIGFELDYIEGRRRELFFFGSGFSSPFPTVYGGSAFSDAGD